MDYADLKKGRSSGGISGLAAGENHRLIFCNGGSGFLAERALFWRASDPGTVPEYQRGAAPE